MVDWSDREEHVHVALWAEWWRWARQLRGSCTRKRTFLWMSVALIGFSVRMDLLGVSSIIRAIGLHAFFYDRVLDLFHSSALDVNVLTRVWVELVIRCHPGILWVNGRIVLVSDGIKVAKSGKRMPAVKKLHQQSDSNTKPTYIKGHSCQAVGLLVSLKEKVMSIPLAARIHEGLVFSNRDTRTLLDRMAGLVDALGITLPFYLVADSYYACHKIARALLRKGNHLVSRVRKNAVAYYPAESKKARRRGRPKVYGKKIALASIFEQPELMETRESQLYDDGDVQIHFRALDLLWKPLGVLVRFVAVVHPTRGSCLLISTDLTLAPSEIIRLYGYRFKIEVSFKAAIHVLGSFLYHFWMRNKDPLKKGNNAEYLHHKSERYRAAIRRKMDAYHRFLQVGLVAQGLMVALATTVPELVWRSYGSWLRTMRPDVCPSEFVVREALRAGLPQFLASTSRDPSLAKFVLEKLDRERGRHLKLAA